MPTTRARPAKEKTPAPPVEESANPPRPAKRARRSTEQPPAPISPRDPVPQSPITVADAPDDEENNIDTAPKQSTVPQGPADLYLDTVNRAALDFDFEKVCSVSLTNINVYCCLVCGKYFQGRSKSTPAFAHSIHEDHHVFMNLESTQVHILPDGYPVSDPSLDDIARVLASFTESDIVALSKPQQAFDLSSTPYRPGYIGLNNIKQNDYLNAVIHSLLHVAPLRDHLLRSRYTGKEPELLKRFAGLAKKLWCSPLFKAQVSPHEFLQEVARASAGRFKITQQGDPVEFLGWILNSLHKDLGGTKRANSSVIYKSFQGEVRLETQQVTTKDELSGHISSSRPEFDIDREIKSTRSPFLLLALELPPPPLFQDAVEGRNIIPQVSIYSLLSKFDGSTSQESMGQLKRFKCLKLPSFLILHFKRFTKNAFVEEKNPTIVNFPLQGLDLREYLDSPDGDATTYDLIANITHESVAGTTRDKSNTAWKTILKAPTPPGEEELWISIQDLIVEEIRKEMIFLGETVLQIWQRRDINSSSRRQKMEVDH